MSKTIIYGATNFKCQSLEYDKDDIVLCELREGTKSLWETKKLSIDKNDNRERKHNQSNSKKYLENATKINNISK